MACWADRFSGACDAAPVLSRFPGYVAPDAPVDVQTLPSGFAQLISGTTALSPILAYQDPTQGAFTRDAGLPPGTLPTHNQYIPAYAPSGIVGGGLFGGGAIGHRIPFHGTLLPVQVSGFTVYEPLNTRDQLRGEDGQPLFGEDGQPLYAYDPTVKGDR